MSTCTRARCDAAAYARGVCRRHYLALRRAGLLHTARADAAPLRKHVQQLLAAGWNKRSIARTAGVSDAAVHELVSGRYRNMRGDTAERLRALPTDAAALIADVHTPAEAGARRCVLLLPWDRPPLHANQRQHHMQHAKTVRQVRETVAWLGRGQHIPAGRHLWVRLSYAPGANTRIESHNLFPMEKASVDALATPARNLTERSPRWVGLQLVPDDDDAHVSVARAAIHRPPEPGPRCWLTVEVNL